MVFYIHLISPGSVGLHLNAHKAGGFDFGQERGPRGVASHVYTLSKVNQEERAAVTTEHHIWVTTVWEGGTVNRSTTLHQSL